MVNGEAAGVLYLVGTPVGNLRDMTPRAIQVLEQVDLIAAEDTRTSARLVQEFDINTSLTSYHDHNEATRATELVERLGAGQDIALISDAGMPAICDPGFELVRAAVEAGFQVTAIPGPTAVILALICSGFAPYPFTFAGFLPRKKKQIKEFLAPFGVREETLVVFVSVHRVREALQVIESALPGRRIAVCRELTKAFEEILRGSPTEVLEQLDESRTRGEFTVVIEGSPAVAPVQQDESIASMQDVVCQQVAVLEEHGYRQMEAIKIVSRGHNLPKSAVYRLVVRG